MQNENKFDTSQLAQMISYMGIKLPNFIYVLSIKVFALFLLIACNADTSSPNGKASVAVIPVKMIDINQTSNNAFVNYPAVVTSQKLVILSFNSGGVLKELSVVEAQKVKQGEVLAKLDQSDLQARLKSAQAGFSIARTAYLRAARLIKQDAIARSKLEQRKSKLDVNKAQLEIAQQALKDSTLIAPYDGNIAKISVREQQIVQAGQAAISILGKDGLEVKTNLPASIIAKVAKVKSQASDAYVLLDVAPNLRIAAHFKEASLEADADSQTYQVVFTFSPPHNLIVLPGMNASLWLRNPDIRRSKIMIPLAAIAIDSGQKYVWLVDKNTMAVYRRNIEIETSVGANVAVISGLNVGDIIVGAGVSKLSEGMKVSRWSK